MQRNTVIFVALVTFAVVAALLVPTNVPWYARAAVGIVAYFAAFATLEYLYYFRHIRIKSEREALANAYDWFDFTTHPANLQGSRGDLSEGLYDGHYHWSAERAMRNKYETYYRYLQLAPGKRLLDLGSGYCHWALFCKRRGVHVVGITLSEPQARVCQRHDISVHVQDMRTFVLNAPAESFDAISALGSLEHLASSGMTRRQQYRVFAEFFRNLNRMLRPEGRALLTYCTMNPKYPRWTIHSNASDGRNQYTYADHVHMYNLATFYGCGLYPHTDDSLRYLRRDFHVLHVRNITEDYRWGGIRFGDHHWQNGRIYLRTPYSVWKVLQYACTDPYIWGRINYSTMKSWYWQFGGDQKTPIEPNDTSPILVNCYVVTKRTSYPTPRSADRAALQLSA